MQLSTYSYFSKSYLKIESIGIDKILKILCVHYCLKREDKNYYFIQSYSFELSVGLLTITLSIYYRQVNTKKIKAILQRGDLKAPKLEI